MDKSPSNESWMHLLIGTKRSKDGISALIKKENASKIPFHASPTGLETIMVHLEKEKDQ